MDIHIGKQYEFGKYFKQITINYANEFWSNFIERCDNVEIFLIPSHACVDLLL